MFEASVGWGAFHDPTREEVGNLFGDQLDMKGKEQLLKRLAVVSQNHLVNIVRLLVMVQAAGVCSLTVQCSCDPGTVVSYADRELLHCLVNGL